MKPHGAKKIEGKQLGLRVNFIGRRTYAGRGSQLPEGVDEVMLDNRSNLALV